MAVLNGEDKNLRDLREKMNKIIGRIMPLFAYALMHAANTALAITPGKYTCDTGESYFVVSGDTLTFYSATTGEYPLSVCHIDGIDDTFIKVSTVTELKDYMQSQVTYEVGDTIADADSLYVRFVTPPAVSSGAFFRVSTITPLSDLQSVGYGDDVVRLKKSDKGDVLKYITVMPAEYTADNRHNQYYGLLYLEFPEIKMEGHNYMKVNMPFMNELFFRKYYLYGEYMKIESDNIISWRGNSYCRNVSSAPALK